MAYRYFDGMSPRALDTEIDGFLHVVVGVAINFRRKNRSLSDETVELRKSEINFGTRRVKRVMFV